jgi:hypothetical protein
LQALLCLPLPRLGLAPAVPKVQTEVADRVVLLPVPALLVVAEILA